MVAAAEEHVARRQHGTPALQCREIHDSVAGEATRLRHDLAVHAQPGHPSVGIDVEAQVGERPGCFDREAVLGVTFEKHLAQHRVPGGGLGEQFVRRGAGRGPRPLDPAGLGVVATEEGGVHDHAVNAAREAEPEETPVVPRLAAAACLPAIHPLAAIRVAPGVPDRRFVADQVLLLGEELVVGGENRTPHAGTGEIDQLFESTHGDSSRTPASRRSSRPCAAPKAPSR